MTNEMRVLRVLTNQKPAYQQQRVGGEQLGQHPQLCDGLGLVPRDQPALDHVLHQHDVE